MSFDEFPQRHPGCHRIDQVPAHDVGDGGLAVAVAELAFGLPEGLGIEIELPSTGDSPHATLFGEEGARYVLLVPERELYEARQRLEASKALWRPAGRVTADGAIRFTGAGQRSRRDLQDLWEDAIGDRMESMEDER